LHRLPDPLPLQKGALVEPLAVACHDVRRGQVKQGDYVVVQGGGPIGTLIALVARTIGARVLISEINPYRLRVALDLGFDAVNPQAIDLPEYVTTATETAGADVVFEVTGSAAGAESMTKLVRVRGRIVLVGVFSETPKVNLFQFYWRELELQGARVYEPQDFEQAIQLAASGALPLDLLISEVCSLDQLEPALHRLESGGEVMKILVQCSEDES
jgi:(R,R)-butanediol dehydrogenase / meso-butanediol dehydrogenase / diacetyl reductase